MTTNKPPLMSNDEISAAWDKHALPVFKRSGINPVVFARLIEAARDAQWAALSAREPMTWHQLTTVLKVVFPDDFYDTYEISPDQQAQELRFCRAIERHHGIGAPEQKGGEQL